MVNLRARNSRTSYAALFTLPSDDEGDQDENDPGAGPSTKRRKLTPIEDPVGSGSDFEPPDDDASANGDGDGDAILPDGESDDEQLEAEVEEEEESPGPPGRGNKLGTVVKTRSKPRGGTGKATIPSAGGALSNIQMLHSTHRRPNGPASANLSSNAARLRPKPLYIAGCPVLRLTEKPTPFKPSKVKSTNPTTGQVGVRIHKAWLNSVTSGPLWELIEDLGWFKEQVLNEDGVLVRPAVYSNVFIQPDDIVILDPKDSKSYLPSDNVVDPDIGLQPPPPVNCSFGPFNAQVAVDIPMFGHVRMSQYFKKGSAHVFNTGGPVWGIDWCPQTEEHLALGNYTQYLAVASFPTYAHSPVLTYKLPRPSPACIQIWSFGPPDSGEEAQKNDNGQDGVVKCEMILCLEDGPAHEIKWCPLPTHDDTHVVRGDDHEGWPKLGIIAGAFGDGSVTVFAVPDPVYVRDTRRRMENVDEAEEGPVFVRVNQPLVRIEHPGTSCTCLDWANSEVILIGCTDGTIMVYNLAEVFSNPKAYPQGILPTHCIPVHQVPITSVTWIRVPPANAQGEFVPKEDPTMVATTAFDGTFFLTDIRDSAGYDLFRARDVCYSTTSGPYSGGPMAIEHENLLKCYGLAPSILGRGHSVSETRGPIWDVSASDHHPYIATASADGTCMTSSLLKGIRRGSIVPILAHKIYQIDFERNTGKYRMLDNFFPAELVDRGAAARVAQSKKTHKRQADREKQAGERQRDVSGAWPVKVGVHRVAWQSGAGIGRSPLLASGTASGLCRIDWLEGRFFQDKMPYGSIERLRGEEDGGGGGGGEEEMMDELDEEEE